MSRKSPPTDRSSSEFNDETSSSDEQRKKSSSRRSTKKDSIRNYVTDVLTKQENDNEQQPTSIPTQIEIGTNPDSFREYENLSAFRRYQTNTEATNRTNAQPRQGQSPNTEDSTRYRTPVDEAGELEDSLTELNLDPNPIREVRDSEEQVYRQKVYLRQLQPPTPQPVEIQVQEVLIKPQIEKAPIHVHVGQREPRTPSPILIKTAPPPPPIEQSEPIVYNKYLPPPKQPPQQIIIHRYPDLPPKPRPIVVEQWLPYKPAPKRIIKHTIPREALQAPPVPRNIIISYSKPRALIEVELVRLPVVKIDPQTYEQLSSGGQQQLVQHPTFQHEQDYLGGQRSTRINPIADQINWRI